MTFEEVSGATLLWAYAGLLGAQSLAVLVLLLRVPGWPARLVVAGLLAATSLLWLLVSKRVEGAVLVVLTAHHGVALADLLVLPGVPLGLALLLLTRFGAGTVR